jgi:hypothetical protein
MVFPVTIHDEDKIIKSRRMRWAGLVVRMGEKMNAYRLLVRKKKNSVALSPRANYTD